MSKDKRENEYQEIVANANEKKHSLVGLYFHSREDGKIKWQGLILRRANESNYLVMLFSWFDGSGNAAKIIPIEQMREWDFYETAIAMRRASSVEKGESDEEFELSERLLAAISKAKGGS